MAISILKAPNAVSSVRNPMAILGLTTYQPEADTHYVKLIIEYEEVTGGYNFWRVLDADIRDYPTQFGITMFNISRIMRGLVDPDPPTNLERQVPAIKTKSIRRYRFTLEEYLDGAKVSSVTSAEYVAVRAGFNYQQGQFLQAFAADYNFYTHSPEDKCVTTNQPEFLYILFPEAGTYSMAIDLEHVDGSTTTGVAHPGGPVTVRDYDMVYFPVGYQHLDLHLQANPVVAYSVYINDPLAQKKRYKVCDCCGPYDRYYLFENSLGGYDTLKTSGKLTSSQETSGSTAEQYPSPFYKPNQRQFFDFETRHRLSYSQASGHLTNAERDWLRDLLRSEEVYRIGGDGPNLSGTGDLIPIQLPRGRSATKKDGEFTGGLTFTYQEAFRNEGI